MVGNMTCFTLPTQFTVDKVEEIKEQMSIWLLTTKEEVECLGSEVDQIDAAGLQLLLAIYKTAVKEGKRFKIVNPSSELQDVFNYSGVDKVFAVEGVD